MSRYDYRKMKPEKRRQLLDELAEIVASFDSKKDARFFLERLLTESEIVMLSRRLKMAELLISGLTYEQIQRKLGVGMATIRSVDKWLTDAAYEYQLIREERRRRERLSREAQQRKVRIEYGGLPGDLDSLIMRDSRFILFRLLLGR